MAGIKRDPRLYRIWKNMKQRCYNENAREYRWYGGKGISVCEEWRNSFLTFQEWALNNGYDEKLTIDRIESNKDYYPENCRWITASENASRSSKERWSGKECKCPIASYRVAIGLTQKQLAEDAGVNIRLIQKVEGSEADAGNLTAKNLLAIADALNVDPHNLI